MADSERIEAQEFENQSVKLHFRLTMNTINKEDNQRYVLST
jgi:hypothetical protein